MSLIHQNIFRQEQNEQRIEDQQPLLVVCYYMLKIKNRVECIVRAL